MVTSAGLAAVAPTLARHGNGHRRDAGPELLEARRSAVSQGCRGSDGTFAGIRASGTAGALVPDQPDARMRPDPVFDAAVLTKILAVGPWRPAGGQRPRRPLGTYWPGTTGHPLGAATARLLLTRTADVPPRAQLRDLVRHSPEGRPRRRPPRGPAPAAGRGPRCGPLPTDLATKSARTEVDQPGVVLSLLARLDNRALHGRPFRIPWSAWKRRMRG
ncbi:hypothetical protein ACFWOB_13445 [Streptomyces sp. NPDC058420]|uniref:hypothetical protein n=1 Tax=Streptomyces sp. NPDC058420 TaxID=3346489 RepID=UPI003653B298